MKISEVKYNNIKGTSATQDGITFSCSQSGSCMDITLDNIDLVEDSGAQASCNAQHVQVQTVGTVIPSGCLGNNAK